MKVTLIGHWYQIKKELSQAGAREEGERRRKSKKRAERKRERKRRKKSCYQLKEEVS